ACLAGVFSLEDALKLIAARGRLMQSLPKGGAMAAIFADRVTVMDRIKPYMEEVSIAAVHGPQNTVISGREGPVQAILDTFTKDGIKASRLNVSHAFHSPLMEPMLAEFEKVAASIQYAKPKIGIISNVTGKLVKDGSIAEAAYWRAHVREAVQFQAGIETLREQGCEFFLEIGPQPTLIGMGRQCIPNESKVWLPSLRQKKEDWSQLLESLGTLYVNGTEVDWEQFEQGYAHRKLPLPTYPFQRKRYWFSTSKESSRPERPMLHPLLNRRVRSPMLAAMVFESEVSVDFPAFLNDHRIYETAIFPAAGYMEMALAAARQIFGSQQYLLTDVAIHDVLRLPEDSERTVQVVLSTINAENTSFEIFSLDSTTDETEENWKQHASGNLRVHAQPAEMADRFDVEQLKNTCSTQLVVSDYYQQLAELGLQYGHTFQTIAQLWQGEGKALGEIALPEDILHESEKYQIHPALLDGCFQLLGASVPASLMTDASRVYVPVGLEALRLHKAHVSRVWASVSLAMPFFQADGKPNETLRADLKLFGVDGALVAEITGLQIKYINRELIRRMAEPRYDDWLYKLDWEQSHASDANPPLSVQRWLIFADQNGLGDSLAEKLQAQGASYTLVTPSDEYCQIDRNNYQLNPDQPEHFHRLLREINTVAEPGPVGIVHLWGLDNPFDANDTDHAKAAASLTASQSLSYGSILYLTQALAENTVQSMRLWLVTRGVHAVGSAGNSSAMVQAGVWGLGRTIALEHPSWKCTCIDLDQSERVDHAQALQREISIQDDENQVALRGTDRYVARLEQYKPKTDSVTIPADQPFELITTSPGVLDNLTLRPVTRQNPAPGEVEIQILATGLNFRDVLFALGMYPGAAIPLGNECAGVVTAIGEGVTDFQVGDEVIALSGGAFRSHVTLPLERVFAKPAAVSLPQAASIPTAFLTAYYGLHHLARIKPGDRVLIHAAAGGVGLAAVQLAQQAGAEIFGTAGSPEKRAFVQSLGVKHVFDSRTLDFADEIMKATGGEGVNIVLNSLTDEFIPKGLSVLANHGCFLEIGKRDAWDQAKVSKVDPTLTYQRYDLGTEMVNDMPFVRTMLKGILADMDSGALEPLPLQTFAMPSVREAFRFMAQAKHIGKIVVTQEESISPIRADGTYLVTGGLGGLGTLMASWMIEQGARHLVLMSRREPTDETCQSLDELRTTYGADIVAVKGDVVQKADIERILSQIQRDMPPLRGIIHAAGVIDDGILTQQNWTRFEHVLAPKVHGAWHLHTLTQNISLDFFILFSSASSLMGSAGQSNYSTANAFLDQLAHHRRARGLPAMSINWGAWSEVGMAAAMQPKTAGAQRSPEMIAPEDGLHILEQLLVRNPVQVGVLPINWNKYSLGLRGRPVPPVLKRLVRIKPKSVETASTINILQDLKDASPERREEMISRHVQQQIVKILGFDTTQSFDSQRALTDLGMDSLMAVELKNKVDADFGINIPVAYFLENATAAALSRKLHDQLGNGAHADETTGEDSKSIDSEKAKVLLENLDQLSEDDMDLLLNNLLPKKEEL
ncbi:MAG: SDR family NAD(P)-dependent oxidoreductase, partial [Anaerolineales bacterium]